MQEMKIIVQEVVKKTAKTGTTYYSINFLDEAETTKYMNVFDEDEAKLLKASGDAQQQIEIAFEMNGEWINLKEIKSDIKSKEGIIIPKAQPKPKGGGFAGAKADPGKIASIERQSSLKQAVEYGGYQTKFTVEEVLATAELFHDWITKPEEPFKS